MTTGAGRADWHANVSEPQKGRPVVALRLCPAVALAKADRAALHAIRLSASLRLRLLCLIGGFDTPPRKEIRDEETIC